MRVRIVALPGSTEVDEWDFRRRFAIGQSYRLPVQVAATLIIAGYAESASPDEHTPTPSLGASHS